MEKIVVIIVAVILNCLLALRYIKRYAPENVIIEAISSFSLGSYISFVIFDIYIPIYIQSLLLFSIFILPLAFVYIQYNNIILTKKILYYKMKFNIYVRDYVVAKELLFKLIERTGRKAEYYYLLGICYKNLDDFINSRDCFALAVGLDKRDYLSYYELGCVLDTTNKRDTAVIMFNNALRIKPDFYEAAESLGISFTSQGRFEEAIKVYQNALEYNPKSYELYYNIAMIEYEIGKTEEAEANFTTASLLEPKLYSAFYNIGTINYLKGDYEKAIKAFQSARSSTVYGGRAYYKLGIVYAAKEEYEKAMTCLDYAFQFDNKYINDAKEEIIFEKLRERILKFEIDYNNSEEKFKTRNNYMKEIEFENKRREKLNNKINKDLEEEKLQSN